MASSFSALCHERPLKVFCSEKYKNGAMYPDYNEKRPRLIVASSSGTKPGQELLTNLASKLSIARFTFRSNKGETMLKVRLFLEPVGKR